MAATPWAKMATVISAPNENSQKASKSVNVLTATVITGPNENSQKASISVYVLAANSQDEVYEGTTRPRPEKRQANTKTRRRDEWHRNRRKKVSLFDTGGKSQTNPKCGVRVSNSEAGIVAPKQEATLRLRTSVQKETNLPHKRLATRTRITKRNYSRE